MTLNGKRKSTLTLTPSYSWSTTSTRSRRPACRPAASGTGGDDERAAPQLHPPTPTFATPFRPMHFYDEQRVLLTTPTTPGKLSGLRARRRIAAWTIVDLVDFEQVAPPRRAVPHSVSVLDFGADPTGSGESANAFDAAIGRRRRPLTRRSSSPPATYQVDRHIVVDDVTIQGAGNWWIDHRGHQVTLSSPLSGRLGAHGRRLYGKYGRRRWRQSHPSTCRTFAIRG